MVLIPGGKFLPFFKQEESKEIQINEFYMDKTPVSVLEFNSFLKTNPEFQKSKISPIFKDPQYLYNWSQDLLSKKEIKKRKKLPVTYVSWFVARKYCASQGKRLPTIAEWEYASDAYNEENINLILKWYGENDQSSPSPIARNKTNKFKLYDMHGLIWEWVEDFNSVIISSDSRAKGEKADGLFCGGGSLNAEDTKQYATFMRYAFRSGLTGNYSTHSLGFRCAKDIK